MKIIFINKLYSLWISDLEKAFRNAAFKENIHFTTISNIFRHEALLQSKTSEKVLEYLNHGKFVPNKLCCELIRNEITRVKKDRIVL